MIPVPGVKSKIPRAVLAPRFKTARRFAAGRRVLAAGLLAASLLAPAPARGDINYDYVRYPIPRLESPASAQDAANLRAALLDLAALFPAHPVNYYLQPGQDTQIWFDNYALQASNANAASLQNAAYVKNGQDYAYYFISLAHELIHNFLDASYGDFAKYAFLLPADYAFLFALNEAAANTWEQVARAANPRLAASRDYDIFHLDISMTDNETYDALENQLRQANPHWDAAQLRTAAGQAFFHHFLTSDYNYYTFAHIPQLMEKYYGEKTLLITPAYAGYRQHAQYLIAAQWQSVKELLPFPLPPGQDLAYFQAAFQQTQQNLGVETSRYGGTTYIQKWIDDSSLEAQMLQRFRANPSLTYDYIDPRDEDNINAVLARYGIIISNTGSRASHPPGRPSAAELNLLAY